MSLDYQKEIEAEEQPQEEQKLIRADFVTPYYSYILIACLIAVFGAQIAVNPIDGLTFGGVRSTLIGGFYKEAFIQGDYWRIFTGAALHGGFLHLFFNCYALIALGRAIEILSNRAHLAVVFLLSVIGGGLMSFAFAPSGISVGASGGIIGFLGYLTIYGFYRRKLMSNILLKNMLFNIGFIAFMGIAVIPNVDNFAHLGGLLMGAIYGFFQIPRDLYEDPREVNSTMEIIGFAALGIFVFVSFLTILLLFEVIRL